MYGQDLSVKAGQVDNGNTTASVEIVAANATAKNRIHLGYLSLGAAGYVVIKSGSTAKTPKLYFPAKGSLWFGDYLQGALNEALTMDATLDAASSGNTPVECNYRFDTR